MAAWLRRRAAAPHAGPACSSGTQCRSTCGGSIRVTDTWTDRPTDGQMDGTNCLMDRLINGQTNRQTYRPVDGQTPEMHWVATRLEAHSSARCSIFLVFFCFFPRGFEGAPHIDELGA
jgi:hypothetical protein